VLRWTLDDAQIHQPEQIASSAAARTLASAVKPEEKIERLHQALAKNEDLAAILGAAIASDLTSEMDGALRATWGGAGLARAFPLLDAVTKHDFDVAEPHAVLVALFAHMAFLASAPIRFWEWLPPFLWLRRRPRIRAATKQLLERQLQTKEWSRSVRAAHKKLKAELDEWRKSEAPKGTALAFIRDKAAKALFAPAKPLDHPQPVMSAHDHAEICSTCDDAVALAVATRAASTETRKDLLRAESCETLLGVHERAIDEAAEAEAEASVAAT
jgi:hypothetical protein